MNHASHRRIVVAGLGNLLMTDDGVGVHAVRALSGKTPPYVRILDVGTAILHALQDMEEADRILLIDAVKAGQAPGTIYRLDAKELDETPLSGSLHSMGLVDAMRLLGRGWRAPEVTVVGVEPAVIAYGSELSPVLQRRLPSLLDVVQAILRDWSPGREAEAVVQEATH